jgi:hypothetical protein
MPNKKRDVVAEAVDQARQLKRGALDNAKAVLTEEVSANIKAAVDKAINEGLGGEGEPPANYDEDGEQKRLGDNQPAVGDTGEGMEDEGNGPAIIEAGIEEMDDEMDFEEEGSDDMDFGDEGGDDEWDEPEGEEVEGMSYEMDDDFGDEGGDDMDFGGEEEEEEELPMEAAVEETETAEGEVAETEVAEMKKENFGLRKENKTLKRTVRRAERAVEIMKETIEDVNLLNARLAGLQKIQSRVSLSEDQRSRVIERLDECESIVEVKRTYRALMEGLRSTRKQTKNRVRRPNIQSSKSTLKEHANPSSGTSRMQTLAGVA